MCIRDRDCRLAVHLLGQRVAVEPFLNDPISSGQGILARFLVHEPKSSISTRQVSQEEWQRDQLTQSVLAFAEKIELLLTKSVQRNNDGDVDRPVLPWTMGASEACREYYNTVESKLENSRADDAIRSEFANKTHEQAARIAGCLLYTSPSPRDATLSRMPSSA